MVEPGSRLYFFSDGAFEIPRPDGEGLLMPSGLADMLQVSVRGGAVDLDPIVDELRGLAGGSFHDDFSIVSVQFGG